MLFNGGGVCGLNKDIENGINSLAKIVLGVNCSKVSDIANNKAVIARVILTQDVPSGNNQHNEGNLILHKEEN